MLRPRPPVLFLNAVPPSPERRWEALRKDKEDMQCELEERIYALVVESQEREAELRKERDGIEVAARRD